MSYRLIRGWDLFELLPINESREKKKKHGDGVKKHF